MNQSVKEFFDSLEYVFVRIVLLGLLALGAWSLLDHAASLTSLHAAPKTEQSTQLSASSNCVSQKKPPRRRQKVRKKSQVPTIPPLPQNMFVARQ